MTRIALSGALLYAGQVALSALPNIEIVTLLIVVFTRNFGKDGILSCFVYVFLTAITWGFGLWWCTYLVIWALFAVIVYRFRKIDSYLIWAVINAVFGLTFGAVFALPYVFISPAYALNYWISGIPYDVAHCIGNFVIALAIGKPLDKSVAKIVEYTDKKGGV